MTCIILAPFLMWESFTEKVYTCFPKHRVAQGYTTSQWITDRDRVLQTYMAGFIAYSPEYHSYVLEFETEEDALILN